MHAHKKTLRKPLKLWTEKKKTNVMYTIEIKCMPIIFSTKRQK